MVGFSQSFKSLISLTMGQLCDEFLVLKKGYFSPRGKPGWNPLKESTLRKKKTTSPAYINHFNVETGQLRDSIEVTWEWTKTGIRITVQVKDDAALVNYLTKTLGRDFLTIDASEKAFIVNRFIKLLKQNAGTN